MAEIRVSGRYSVFYGIHLKMRDPDFQKMIADLQPRLYKNSVCLIYKMVGLGCTSKSEIVIIKKWLEC